MAPMSHEPASAAWTAAVESSPCAVRARFSVGVYGVGVEVRKREGGERERREGASERERERRGYEPFALHKYQS